MVVLYCICPRSCVPRPMYKSRLYIRMHLWPGFSDHILWKSGGFRPNLRDLYTKAPFWKRFPVQVRFVRLPLPYVIACSDPLAGPIQAKTPRNACIGPMPGPGRALDTQTCTSTRHTRLGTRGFEKRLYSASYKLPRTKPLSRGGGWEPIGL